jgi:predicted dehydrogenase
MGPVRVGLVGAGPWARLFTGPLLARGPACELTAVWARRADAAAALAARHGAVAASSFEELLERCEAVAFAVPPDVQADLAGRAATAGRPVLLDKPIGLQLSEAERVADAIGAAGVASQLVLTNRYRPSMRAFLADRPAAGTVAARCTFLGGGAVPGGTFATPWRLQHGSVADLGPHVVDALDVALGPIVDVHAAGSPLGVVALTCTHEGGATSQATLSVTTPADPSGLALELFGPAGVHLLDTGRTDATDGGADIRAAMSAIAHEFAATVRSGTSHQLDVQRGLVLQRTLDAATRQLSS